MFALLTRLRGVSRPRAVGSITVGHGVNEFFAIVIPPIIPFLVSDLGLSYGQAGFLVTVFFLMYVLFQLPAGMLADVVGKERLLVAGLFGMAGGIFVASTATSYGTLLVGQTIAGISGSAFHPTGMALISDYETANSEGKAMGVFGFGGAVGTMSAPVVVGGVAVVAGWRPALASAVAIGVVITCLVVYLFATADEPDDNDATEREAEPRTDGGNVGQTVRRAIASRTLPVDLTITRGIVVLFFITVVLSMQHRAIQTYTTSYVAAETGTSASVGNITFFALLVGGSLASLYAGDLADRFDRVSLGIGASLGTALLVAGTLVLAPVSDGLPIGALTAVLAVWFAVIGVGMYTSYPVKNAMVSRHAETASSGSLFGVIQTGSAIGSASGPAVFGVLSTRWGVVAAFPAIAGVSVVLAGSFALLWLTSY